MQSSASDVAVIVGSCDKYSFAWPPFCHGLNKYWPNSPWPVYIVTNHLDAPCGQTLKIGDDPGWTETVRIALQTIDKPVVLWMADDAWLTAPPDMPTMLDWAGIVLRGEADYIRLTISHSELGDKTYPGETYPGDPRLFIVPPRFQYRASLHPALWNAEVFLSLLRDGESTWGFEIQGSKRAWSDDERFLCAKDAMTWPWPHRGNPDYQDYKSYGTPLIRGYWTAIAAKYAKCEGITLDPKAWRWQHNE